jgi:hypothetical protein
VWRVLAIAVALTGCGRLFGLEPPVHDDSIPSDGAKSDGAGPSDARVDTNMTADASSIAGCPSTYTVTFGLSTSRYRIGSGNQTSWDAAQAACLQDQLLGSQKYTHLLVAATDAELAAVEAAVDTDIWVGLSDRAIEVAYQWVTQETNNYPPTSGDPWGTGEPKASATEDCVLVSNTGDLEVRSCGTNKPYICECDTFMNDPTKY